MELTALSEPFASSGFSVFRGAIEAGGKCAASSCRTARATRGKDLDNLIEEAKQLGAAGSCGRGRRKGRAEPGAQGGRRGHDPPALELAGAGPSDLLLLARARTGRPRGCSGSCG
jgi:hypothetical protein